MAAKRFEQEWQIGYFPERDEIRLYPHYLARSIALTSNGSCRRLIQELQQAMKDMKEAGSEGWSENRYHFGQRYS